MCSQCEYGEFGSTDHDRIQGLEAEVAALNEEIVQLKTRLERLEFDLDHDFSFDPEWRGDYP